MKINKLYHVSIDENNRWNFACNYVAIIFLSFLPWSYWWRRRFNPLFNFKSAENSSSLKIRALLREFNFLTKIPSSCSWYFWRNVRRFQSLYLIGIKVQIFSEKNIENCAVFIIIVITFANQIFLWLIWLQVIEMWTKFQKIWVC